MMIYVYTDLMIKKNMISEIIREFNENIRAHQRREGNPPDGPNLEQVPLLSQNSKGKKKNYMRVICYYTI